MSEAGEDNSWTAPHPAQGGGCFPGQLPGVSHDQASDLMLFELSPEIFDRVKLRRVGRQRLNHKSLVRARHKVFDQFAAVDHGAVPKDQKWAVHMAQECAQELYYLWSLDGTWMNLKVEVPKAESGDERETLPAKGLLDDRGLPARSPSPHPMRTGAQSAFVDENDGAAFARGFFLRLGQV